MDVRADYMAWKKKNGYNQHEVAAILECSRPAIASFESGRSPYPRGDTLLKMLAVLYPEWDSAHTRRTDHVCVGCKGTVPGPQQGAKYCMQCGLHFGNGCSKCGHVNLKGARFCNDCGHQSKA
jgi:DNA-binding XRE family transcriptional regulator